MSADWGAIATIVLAALAGAAFLSWRQTRRSVLNDCSCNLAVLFSDMWEPSFDFADGNTDPQRVSASDGDFLRVADAVGVVP